MSTWDSGKNKQQNRDVNVWHCYGQFYYSICTQTMLIGKITFFIRSNIMFYFCMTQQMFSLIWKFWQNKLLKMYHKFFIALEIKIRLKIKR